jgi:hypothetical protein
MPNQPVLWEAVLDPGREHWDSGKCREKISGATRVVHLEAG